MKYKIPIILFAGGKSSRMGTDKALLPFAGYPTLSEYQYRRLEILFETVYLSSKSQKFDFPAKVITDHYEEYSPLVGLISVFEALKVDEIFVLSIDAPFVNKTVIERVIQKKEKYDAVIARTARGKQPLCGLYKRSVLKTAKAHLYKENHRLGNLLDRVSSHSVFFEDENDFLNLNHPHDYKEAKKILKQKIF